VAETEQQGEERESSEEKFEQEREEAREEMKKLEEADELPDKIEDWPDGKAKYETFGGPEGEDGYEEGPTSKLGPSSLRHHEDGSVSIEGEKVDNPEEYKGDPIPGGPTDPNAPDDVGVTKTSLERQDEEDGEERSEEESAPS
jgi:hypothetical protein